MRSHTFSQKSRFPLLFVRAAAKLLYLRLNAFLTGSKVEVIVLMERLGDLVACEAAALAAKRSSSVRVAWICAQRFAPLVDHFRGVDAVIPLGCLADVSRLQLLFIGFTIRNLHPSGKQCEVCGRGFDVGRVRDDIDVSNYYNYGGLQTAFFSVGGLPLASMERTGFISRPVCRLTPKLPPLFFVVHCSSEEGSRSWPPEEWIALLDHLKKKYSAHAVVEIGGASVLPSGLALNFCGDLGLLELVEVMRQATFFVGIDSGPSHVANAFGIPRLILLGRYRVFERYLPYDGFHETGKGGLVVRYWREVRFLPAAMVIEIVSEWDLNGPSAVVDVPPPYHDFANRAMVGRWSVSRQSDTVGVVYNPEQVGLFVHWSGECPSVFPQLNRIDQSVCYVAGSPVVLVLLPDKLTEAEMIYAFVEEHFSINSLVSSRFRFCFASENGEVFTRSIKGLRTIGTLRSHGESVEIEFTRREPFHHVASNSDLLSGNVDNIDICGDKFRLSGWSVLSSTWPRPADRLVLARCNDGVWNVVAEAAGYRSERTDVAAHFNNPSLLFSGWTIEGKTQFRGLAVVAIDSFSGDSFLQFQLPES
jgi:heptosyltransferase III